MDLLLARAETFTQSEERVQINQTCSPLKLQGLDWAMPGQARPG